MRGRSYSPSPPPRRRGRSRTPSPRGRYGGGRSSRPEHDSAPTSLLVRNLRHDCRPDDLYRLFEEFGTVKDVYLPRDYHSGHPRGFGFVQFLEPADADEAKYQMDRQVFQGRELTVVFAEENRKKPTEMRARDRGSSRRQYDRRRSPPPRYGRSPSRSPRRRQCSRSVSPQEKRSYHRSPVREDLSPPPYATGSPVREDRSPPPYAAGSPVREDRSPPYSDRHARSPSGSRSMSPAGAASPPYRDARRRSPSGSRSRSPEDAADYRRMPERDGNPFTI